MTTMKSEKDQAIEELCQAIRLTVEYTGNDILPAIEGWSWFDALSKYAPEMAQRFVERPIHFPETPLVNPDLVY